MKTNCALISDQKTTFVGYQYAIIPPPPPSSIHAFIYQDGPST